MALVSQRDYSKLTTIVKGKTWPLTFAYFIILTPSPITLLPFSYQLGQNCNDRTPVGEIHLKDHWLIEAGFDIDASVKIQVMQGCLVVTAEVNIHVLRTWF